MCSYATIPYLALLRFETRSLLNLEFTVWAKLLAIELPRCICFHLPSTGAAGTSRHAQLFMWVMGTWTQVLTLVWQTLCGLSHSPSSTLCFWPQIKLIAIFAGSKYIRDYERNGLTERPSITLLMYQLNHDTLQASAQAENTAAAESLVL